ncbi:MAG: hypothetical protein ABDH20_05775 [Thermus sp.]
MASWTAPKAFLASLLLALPWGLAQEWRLTRSQSLTAGGAQAWRYTLSPTGKEAQALWRALAQGYQAQLRSGYRVDLGAWRTYFLGGRLRVEPHCPRVNAACFSFIALPWDKARLDRFLLELSALLDQALAQARHTGGVVVLTRLFRLQLSKGSPPPYLATPSGWRP